MRMNTPYIPTRLPGTSLHQNSDARLLCLLPFSLSCHVMALERVSCESTVY